MPSEYDVIIIGAGIVGLATALQLQKQQNELRILVLEKEEAAAKHQTGNNSGVIHSGIYYKPGSLKAKNCREGYMMLLDYLKKKELPFDLCGKVIVATEDREIEALNEIERRGKENGLDGIRRLDADGIKQYEPHIHGVQGLFVPQTGICDYGQIARSYADDIRENGGEIRFGEAVQVWKGGEITTEKGSYRYKLAINCAGVYCDKMAEMRLGKLDLRIIPFRGEYFELKPSAQKLVKNLVYPVPDPSFPFLGVHFTRMIGGGVEAGPNAVFALAREGYSWSDVHLGELSDSLIWPGFRKLAMKYWKTGLGEMHRSLSKRAFTKALQKLLPEIRESDLKQGGAGVRAQACLKNGNLVDDFFILEQASEIHVLNAPSPAATSSLSIGKHIAGLAKNHL